MIKGAKAKQRQPHHVACVQQGGGAGEISVRAGSVDLAGRGDFGDMTQMLECAAGGNLHSLGILMRNSAQRSPVESDNQNQGWRTCGTQ